MDEKLFYEFLKVKGLKKEFIHFIESKNRAKNNLRYHLYIMNEHKDDWTDDFFTITKDDKDFLQTWSKTISPTDPVIDVGILENKVVLYGENIQKIFSDCDRYFDDKKSFYEIELTEREPMFILGSAYDEFYYLFERIYKDFDNELRNLFLKTSFYKLIKEEEELREENRKEMECLNKRRELDIE